jgi:hypothetical protein
VVHLVDQRTDLLDREVAHALLEHLLFFGQERQRRARLDFECGGGHGSIPPEGVEFSGA